MVLLPDHHEGDARVTRTATTPAFEAFRHRVLRAAAATAALLVAAAAVTTRGAGPLACGLAVGCAASLAGFAVRVRALRRMPGTGDRTRRSRASLAVLARLGLYAAALLVASATDAVGFWPTVVGLFLANAATVVLAVRDARRPQPQA